VAKATGILAVLLALGLTAAGAAQNSTSAAKKSTSGAPSKSAAAKSKAAASSKSGPSAAAKSGQAASKGASKSVSGKTAQPTRKTAAKASAKTAAGRTASRSKRRSAARPAVQQQPTPERYREIQQALIDRGYLEGEPTGRWDPASIEALKRFQGDQQLQPTGKIDALSLIRLGLGPRRQNLAFGPSPSQASEVQTEP